MDRKIQIGIAVALIALLLFVVPMIDTNGASSAAMDDEYSEENGDSGSSNLGGTASVFAKIVDGVDNTIWASTDDRFNLPESVVDPVSGKEAVNFIMGVRYDAVGTNIDWSTMKVTSNWELAYYKSTTALKKVYYEWSTQTLTAQQSGDLQSTYIALDPLVPQDVTMIFWDYDEATGRKTYVTETYSQRTAESHPFQLVFLGHYYVEVYDSYGQKYDQYYKQTVTLDLQWVGSEFGIEWSDPDQEEPDPTGSKPSLNELADFVAFQGDVKDFSWNWADIDADINKYTVSVDGIVITDSALTGLSSGTINWAHKFTQLGEHVVQVSVEDLQGNIATDSVTVIVHSGIDPIINGDPLDPIDPDPLDPIRDVGAESDFERPDDPNQTPALSLFGGTGNTQILVLLAVGAGAGWLLYQSKKKR